jgi:hypothetical protein
MSNRVQQFFAPQSAKEEEQDARRYLIALDKDRNPIFLPLCEENKHHPAAGGFSVYPDHTALVVQVDGRMIALIQEGY